MSERTTGHSWVRAVLHNVGLHLLIAAVLTAFLIGRRWTWPEMFQTFAVNLVFSVCIGAVAWFFFGRVLPRLGLQGWKSAVALAVGLLLAVGIGVELALALIGLVWGPIVSPGRGMLWRVASMVTLVMMVVSIAFDQLRARARKVELRAQEAQRELLQARLQNLQDRLNPHFLFNSLNALAGLIEEDPPRAVATLERLCDLLRYGLESSEDTKTSLGRELEVLGDYLAMEELRFGDRLRWRLNVDPELREVRVPVLLLQPVVENAVKYGVAPRRAGGFIQVRGARVGQRLRLEVTDDGPGTSEHSGTMLGEQTLRQRLELAYGDRADVQTGPHPEGGYQVRIDIPLEGAPV